MRGWQPVQASPGGEPKPTPSPAPSPLSQAGLARSPFMHASMPLMASTSDAFTRQFYSPVNTSQQRIMPIPKRGS